MRRTHYAKIGTIWIVRIQKVVLRSDETLINFSTTNGNKLLVLCPDEPLPPGGAAMTTLVCEYYDPFQCGKDPNYCNRTESCPTPDEGKRSHCYALWTNTSGVIEVLKKGCWLDAPQCYDLFRCVESDSRQLRYYCCCEGDMCNVNLFVSASHPTDPPNHSSPGVQTVFLILL